MMSRPSLKRGIATAVVGSLSLMVTPWLAAPASAYNLIETPVLHTQESGKLSNADDSENTTIHLLVTGLAVNSVNIESVEFTLRYNDNAFPIEPLTNSHIATVAASLSAPGVFSYEWSPTAAQLEVLDEITGLQYDGIQIIAQPKDGSGANLGPELTSTSGLTYSSTGKVTNIFQGGGHQLGVFKDGFQADAATAADWAVVTGTTTSGTLNIDSPNFVGTGVAAVISGTGIKTFAAKLDLTSIDTSAADNQIVLTALGKTANSSGTLIPDSDDADVVTVYRQSIGEVLASATTPNVADPGDTTDVTVQVLDQFGRPIAGARVAPRSYVGDCVFNPTTKVTNLQGLVTFSGACVGTYEFYADGARVSGYQAQNDVLADVTITSFDSGTAALALSSADGDAFDFDEYTAGDITVTATDASAAPRGGSIVKYVWKVLPFTAPAGTAATQVAAGQTAPTNGETGKATIPFPTGEAEGSYILQAYLDKNASGTLDGGDLVSSPLALKAGEAEIHFDDETSAQRLSGSDATFTGAVQLDDGTALVGRAVDITWAAAVAGNAAIADQAKQPAGTTRTGATTANAVSGAGGNVSLVITDPSASPNVDELNGTLTETVDDVATQLDVDFLEDVTVATIDSSAAELHGAAAASPGRPVEYTLTARNAAGQLLDGATLAMTTDHGFFTPNFEDGEFTPAGTPSIGGQVGSWKNNGPSKNVVTGDSGTATVTVAIGRDAAFDNDGLVTALVKAKSGAITKQISTEFDSANPLNIGAITVSFDNTQQSTVLPKARIGQTVNFDVVVTDQFGNRVAVKNLSVSDNSTNATAAFDTPGDGAPADSVFTGSPSTLHATNASGLADSQKLTVTSPDATRTLWTADGGDSGNALDRGASTANVAGVSPVVTWYVADGQLSTVRLTTSASGPVRVGTGVNVTVVVRDQFGQVLPGADVQIYRDGPGGAQDLVEGVTNAAGKVFYAFVGTTAGNAKLATAALVEGDVTEADADVVTFKYRLKPVLTAANDASGNDELKVDAGANAAGVLVKLYRIKADGSRVLVAKAKANAKGLAKFVVEEGTDSARLASTRYIAVLPSTKTTFTARSNVARIQ
jgi:hypothetical protein